MSDPGDAKMAISGIGRHFPTASKQVVFSLGYLYFRKVFNS